MKKPVRLLLLGTALLVAVVLIVAALAFHSGVQTWAARRALAGQPNLKGRLGQVSAGFQTVSLHDLHLEQDGAVIALPTFVAEFSVIDAGLNQKFYLRRLVARGWTLDLTGFKLPAAAPQVTGASAVSASPAAAVAQVFQGIFAQVALPFDLTLDGVELEGEVNLPPVPGTSSGRAHVVLKGGGLAAGREGSFTFDVTVALAGADVPVSSLAVNGSLGVAMDTPRTFSRLAIQAGAAATGPKFPGGVKLTTELAASRSVTGETYAVTLSDGRRQLAKLTADLPRAKHRLAGAWKLDVRDTDLAPFTLGRILPAFALVGEGALDLDVASADIRATGKLNAAADKLGTIRSELAAIGAVKLIAEFDLARRGDGVRVDRLTAAVAGSDPVAHVQALQPFEFNPKTGELKVVDPARDLLGLVLQDLPLAWMQPLLKDVTVSGGNLRGEFVAIARNGGFSLRPKIPLTIAGLSVARGGKPRLRDVDISLTASADYTPHGWQAEFAPLVVKSSAVAVLKLEGKAGQLVGKDQPIKVAGNFSSDLPAALAQPAAGGLLALVVGSVAGDFVASFGAKTEIQAKLSISNLAGDPQLTAEKLPSLATDLRADITSSGAITLNVPLLIERDGRKSDLTFAGTLTSGKSGFAVDGNLTSSLFVTHDAAVLTAIVPPAPVPTGEGSNPTAPDIAPPWAGVSGRLGFALKKVVCSEALQVSDITGTLSLDAGAAKLVNFRAGLGEGADAKVNGGVTFRAKSPMPYALAAEFAVNEFDPAPLFRALHPDQPVTVEGKFSVASQLSGQAARLADFASATTGDFQFSSKGGVFRGLPVRYAAKVEATGKIAAGAAAIGNLFSSVTGKKDSADVANKAQAVTEFAKMLEAIPYDQLNVAITRDAALNTVLKDFTLIAPELRLAGGGQVTYRPGAGLLEQPLAMEFKLRARGRPADLMKYLGALDPQADDLGYATCTLPLKIFGSMSQPDTSELNQKLASLALEKSGVTEKASELFNKLLGGGK